MTTPIKDKRFFLTQKPPEGYIAGVARGAIGFTTRSDIGSARNVEFQDVPGFQNRQGGFQQGGRGRGGPNNSMNRGSNTNDTGISSNGDINMNGGNDEDENGEGGEGGGGMEGDDKFDEFQGDVSDRFQDSSTVYDQEDEEADNIWESIDKKMDSRRKTRREENEKIELEREAKSKPNIKEQLSDLKDQLSTMTDDDWSSIPDSGDYSKRNVLIKQQKKYTDFLTPIPDSLIEKARSENETTSIISTSNSVSGNETTDLTQVGSARKKVLDLKLNQMSDSVDGKTCVDPKGYLTHLKSVHIASDAEVGDIKRARKLFKSVITTNPTFFPGWLAATKLEVLDGKLADARKLIAQACNSCPKNEEVWIENAKLQTPENAKSVLGQAITIIPYSVRIWLYAMNLEKTLKMKRKVIRRALEYIPTSVKLWKEAVELEDDPNDAKVLLSRAVECISDNVELWLAYANLESNHQAAREILNRGREALPASPEIWIAAAQLEESMNKTGKASNIVRKIIQKAIKSLSVDLMVMDREKWIGEAEKSERNGYISTCEAIIQEGIGMGIMDEKDRKRIWKLDAEECIARGSLKTGFIIYSHIQSHFPEKKSIYLRKAQLAKNPLLSMSKDQLDDILQEAIKHCPTFEIFWLMRAKEKWIHSQTQVAREILAQAFKANPGSEEIWLAAVKIESELNEIKKARQLLKNARETAPTERIFMKSSLLEREFGHDEVMEQSLIEQGLLRFPSSFKLWLMKAQLLERLGKGLDQIRQSYLQAQQKCPNSVAVWVESSRFEIRQGKSNVNRARSQLEVGRNKNTKSQDIYLELSRFEMKHSGNLTVALKYLSVGLQECSQSGTGKLWAEIIQLEPPHSKRNKCFDALNRCNNDPHVLLAVAKVFWFDSKLDKAKEWFLKLIDKFPDFGDAYAYYYTFLLKTNENKDSSEDCLNLLKKSLESEPRHGELWIQVSKQIGNSKLKSDQILKQVSLKILEQSK